MKKDNTIDAWIKQAFEKAGEQAAAMEIITDCIKTLIEEKTEDILTAWAEISDTASVVDLCEQAEEDDGIGEALDNLMRMGAIAGYLAAIDDMRKGKHRLEK